MKIARSAADGLVFRHAVGTQSGTLPSAPLALVHARAFRALRGLGFGEGDARRALAEILRDPDAGAELDVVLRQCLELLTERAWTRAS